MKNRIHSNEDNPNAAPEKSSPPALAGKSASDFPYLDKPSKVQDKPSKAKDEPIKSQDEQSREQVFI